VQCDIAYAASVLARYLARRCTSHLMSCAEPLLRYVEASKHQFWDATAQAMKWINFWDTVRQILLNGARPVRVPSLEFPSTYYKPDCCSILCSAGQNKAVQIKPIRMRAFVARNDLHYKRFMCMKPLHFQAARSQKCYTRISIHPLENGPSGWEVGRLMRGVSH
jgi:hypothetical protein